MADIGEMLREARMRAGIDISEVEAATKIRAKYLRALENEEWGLLPGNAYVKGFLRTYAEALGLDPKLVVEEYKLHHERLSEMEMQPIVATPSAGERAARAGMAVPRGWLIAGVAIALVVVLGILGLTSRNNSSSSKSHPTATGPTGPTGTPVVRHPAARFQIIATNPVYVCLISAQGHKLIGGRTLASGERTRVYRSRRFYVLLGNGSARVKINGRASDLPPSANPISFAVGPKGRRPLAANRTPNCG
ncbi:MAG: helix-turn-helix domain-containing protein [Actinobacteria bacterium]|nr:MAG: helix-turn-helix domain-containing protein [Actinomycetota bacterium]